MTPEDPSPDTAAERLADRLQCAGLRVAVAESLTSGAIASALGRASGASDWFLGGAVAYSPRVKHTLLGVTPGPVVTARCAEEMAIGTRRVFASDLAVAVTGVGGPGAEEGEPAGTVYLAWSDGRGTGSRRYEFDGDPGKVVEQTVRAAIATLLDRAG